VPIWGLDPGREAWRAVRRAPTFAFAAVVVMGLGVGAASLAGSLAYDVLVKPLPWPDAGRLVRIEEQHGGRSARDGSRSITNGTFHAWADRARTIDGLAAWTRERMTLTGAEHPRRLAVAGVTPSLFDVLRTSPSIGRAFSAGDVEPGAPAVAIISDGLWRRQYGAEPTVLGRTIDLDGQRYAIVGIMPPGFRFPDADTSIWLPTGPLRVMSADGRRARVVLVEALARLRPGVTAAEAAREGQARARLAPDIGRATLAIFGSQDDATIVVTPLIEAVTRGARPSLVLFAAVAALLLLAMIASVAGMQLVRTTARRRDTAVRLALGAGTARLLRDRVAEGALLGVGAAAMALVLVRLAYGVVPVLLPPDFPRLDNLHVSGVVACLTVVAAVVTGVVSGVAPTVSARRRSALSDLTEGAGTTFSTRTSTGRWQLIVTLVQVATACALLIVGVRLVRSFDAMRATDRGYDASHLLTARLSFPESLTTAQRVGVLEALEERIAARPGVTAVAFGNGAPFAGAGNIFGATMPSPDDAATPMRVSSTYRVVSPGYLRALGARLVSGRLLTAADTETSPRVLVVNEAFATAYLGRRPLGRRLPLFRGETWQVVGIVRDMQPDDLSRAPAPEFFLSYRQHPAGVAFDPVMLVRSAGDPMSFLAAIEDGAVGLEPRLAVDSAARMDARVRASLGLPRAYSAAASVLALLALVVATTGVFVLLSCAVIGRRREISLRVALGASPRSVVTWLLTPAMRVVAIGTLAGALLTVAGARLWSSLVYGLPDNDIASVALAAIVVFGAAVLACVLPVRRALRVDPAADLRR
jgi:predicted permease